MSDKITVLRSLGLNLAKVWKTDGSIEPYSRAKQFNATSHDVSSIDDLSALLTRLETQPFCCVVRGQPKPDVDMPMRRLIESVDDEPLHAVLIEVDEFVPLVNDPVTDSEEAAIEFIHEHLPAAFHEASFHWQLSNSAGASGKEHLLKVHLWYYLKTPYDSATLRAWAITEGLEIDRSVLNPVQVHYTSLPVFEPGRSDPVVKRSGFHRGSTDHVDLRIDTDALTIKSQGVRLRGETRVVDDPQADFIESSWETFGELSNGGVLCLCPFEHEHSGGAQGDSSTVYFPSGSNGYAEGRWVCLHNSCRDRPQAEFAVACGFSETRLAALAAPMPTINGHNVHEDTSVLPPFLRTQRGIVVNMTNIQSALRRPDVAGLDMKLDSFREEILCAPPGGDEWVPLTDEHFVDLRVSLEKVGFPLIGKDLIRDSAYHRAAEQRFDTAIDWLSSVTWDGVERIATFWIDHFGVPDDPAGYARAVGEYTWTALAGRALVPGMQADMAPILTGPQGIGKSRGVAAMAPMPEFATTMSFHEPEVERTRKMRGTLVVELAELQGLRSRDREEILAWVTRSQEHWTPKYKEMSKTFKRRFIMFATTNDDDFLDDPTGERRWLPLACGKRHGFGNVHVPGIAAVRDQLWAEGAARFAKDGLLWRDAERLARGVHGEYKSDDLWLDCLRRWFDTPDMSGQTPRQKGQSTTHEIAEGALGMAAKNVKWGEQRRLAKLLKQEGFEQVVGKVEGKSTRVWKPVGFV